MNTAASWHTAREGEFGSRISATKTPLELQVEGFRFQIICKPTLLILESLPYKFSNDK